MTDLLTAALEYAAAGIAVIPCQPRGKKPALAATGKNHSVATSDSNQIRDWWATNPDYNIGIPGTPNQLAVIDIDGDGGVEYIEQHPELAEPLHDTWAAATAKGAHYYYRWPAGLEIRTCDIAPQLEIRAAGAYTIAPPSIHPNGHQYTWKRRATQTPPELPPEWAALTPQQQPANNVVHLQADTQPQPPNTVALKRLHGFALHLANTTKGNRHKGLYTIARTLGQLAASNHLTPEEIETALTWATETNGLLQEDGPRNIAQTIQDGIQKGIQDGPDPEHHETTQPIPYTLPATPKDTPSDAPSSWEEQTVDDALDGTLQITIPSILTRSDGKSLIYPGHMHTLAGEPETGKSWIAIYACHETIQKGGTATYIDLESNKPRTTDRLKSFGAPTDRIRKRFRYIHPHTAYTSHDLAYLRNIANKRTLIVIDGVTDLLAQQGADPDSNPQVANIYRELPRMLADQGAAVLMLDHVTKTREGRGRWAIGAQHKLAGVDGAAYIANVINPLRKGGTGSIRIYLSKDRPGEITEYVTYSAKATGGSIPRYAADFHLTDNETGTTATLEPVVDPELTENNRYATEIHEWLEIHAMAASTRAIADAVGHGVPKIAKPLAMLEAEDSVETTRDGRGVYYRFKNPRPTYVLPTNTQPATTRDALAISSDRKSDRPATPAAYPPVGGVAGVASRSIAAEQLPDPY